MKTFLAVCSGVLLALCAAPAGAQSTTYDYDKSFDFSKAKTYAWVQGTPIADPLIDKRIVGAVDEQLTAKRLTKVEPGANPDLLVAYHASFDKDLTINGFSSGWGGYRFGGMRSGTATVDEILIGTIVVDMVDAQQKAIVWRGTASKEVDTKASPEKRDKNIRKAAQKVFKKYPPKVTS
jgi:hypothetical protein